MFCSFAQLSLVAGSSVGSADIGCGVGSEGGAGGVDDKGGTGDEESADGVDSKGGMDVRGGKGGTDGVSCAVEKASVKMTASSRTVLVMGQGF